MLICSAAIAVTIAAREAGRRGWTIGFGVVSAVFLCTTVVDIIERPDGVKLGACFVAGIILISIAPVAREILREAEPDRDRRPRVHVG